MPIVSYTIAASGDEGYEEVVVSPGTWGTLVLAGFNTPPDTTYHAGWWWDTAVPALATINSALLKIRARDTLTGTLANIHLAFFGYDADNASVWVTLSNVPSNMPLTTAKLDYDPAVWVVDDYYTFELASVVQEIVSRPGFGGNLAIALMNDGTTGVNNLSFYRFGDGDSESGKITIDYTEGGLPWLPRQTNLQGSPGALWLPGGMTPPSKV
jgi:hypothetical protein